MSVDYQTFCIYCQREYHTLTKLGRHVARVHPGTYADVFLNGANTDAGVITESMLRRASGLFDDEGD